MPVAKRRLTRLHTPVLKTSGAIPPFQDWSFPPVPMSPADLEGRLHAAFPDAEIVLTDLAGDGDHYKARIVSPAFAGLPRVRQHQLVNKALSDVLGTVLHALALETAAP